MSECPTCGVGLRTVKSLPKHHEKVHGAPLPNLTCKGCDSPFYHPKADRAFCEDCDFRVGEHNPNWRAAKEEAECKICGETFEYYPSDKKGVYCPRCVESSEEFLGTPSYEVREVERVQKDCRYCGKTRTVLKSDVDRGQRKFCDIECFHAWLSDRWGETHKYPYVGPWYSVRLQALERDDHRCQLCGITREEIGQEPDVHHIRPVREFEDITKAHRLENVIALCRTCHRQAEWGHISRAVLYDAQK